MKNNPHQLEISNCVIHHSVVKQRAYTLIEMLISVTIFSSLLIIVLGSIASASSSSAKVSNLREKSQATRSIIDRITTDLRYSYLDVEVKDIETGEKFRGFDLRPNGKLVILLHYPGDIRGDEILLARKVYQLADDSNGRPTIYVQESRNCVLESGNPPQLTCEPAETSSPLDLLSQEFTLDNSSPDFTSAFTGLVPSLSPPTPYLTVTLTVKPTDYITDRCDDLAKVPVGTCYKISTTINLGR